MKTKKNKKTCEWRYAGKKLEDIYKEPPYTIECNGEILWSFRTFYKHCPNCGRKIKIKGE